VVEFRAGKMTMSGNLVTPDKRKGLIQVEQGEDTLMHFKWKDRGTGVVEDDLIIFPDDIEFVRVDQCKTGRVYLLKFKSSSRRMFFWMQEPKEDKDEELCKKVNDSLNKGAAAVSDGPGGRSGGGGSLAADLGSLGSALGLGSGAGGRGGIDLSDSGLQSFLQNMNQQQLAQLLGGSLPMERMERGGSGAGGRTRNPASDSSSRSAAASSRSTPSAAATPAAAAAGAARASESSSGAAASATTATAATKSDSTAAKDSTPASGTSSVPIQLTDLQSVLSGIKVPEGMEGLAGAAGGSKDPPVDLSIGLTGAVVTPLLTNPDFVTKMKKLLPAGEQEEVATAGSGAAAAGEAIDSTIKSPQFKQAMQMFSSGLQSGQLAPLIGEFDLGDEAIAAAAAGNLEAFVKAIEKNKKDDAKAKKDEDDEMGGLD